MRTFSVSAMVVASIALVVATCFGGGEFAAAQAPPLPPVGTLVPSIYGSPEAFGNIMMGSGMFLWPNTPVPAGCPAWVSAEWGVVDKISGDADQLNATQVKSAWNMYNLSPLIGPQFSIDAFMSAVTGVTPITDQEVNVTVTAEYFDMRRIIATKNLWAEYGVGQNPQCLIVEGAAPTIPPMPSELLNTTLTTPYVGPTDPPMPTEPMWTDRPSGEPMMPTYEPGSLLMKIDPAAFPSDSSGREDYSLFLADLQKIAGFDTTTLHIHSDLWDPTQKIISNATQAQAQTLTSLSLASLTALGVISIRLANSGDNFPSADIIPESDYNRLVNITAVFERASPLPSTCPAYLTNDTLLVILANKAYPVADAIPIFSQLYGPEFDGWNTSCLYQYWALIQGQDPSCPADFGNVFPTLVPGNGMGSGSSGIPSGDSSVPSSDSPSSGVPSSGDSNIPSSPSPSASDSPSSDVPSGESNAPSSPSSPSSDSPPSSDLPSPSSPSSDSPSSDSPSSHESGAPSSDPSPSGFFPTEPGHSGSGSMPFPTTPSDTLRCKVPFQNYASCVLAQNTLGIVLYLRDAKTAQPECFCKGSDCVTPPPSTLYPDVTANSNGSFDTGFPPISTYANETLPPLPPFPTKDDGNVSDPFESVIQSMMSDVVSAINESEEHEASVHPSSSPTPAPPAPTTTTGTTGAGGSTQAPPTNAPSASTTTTGTTGAGGSTQAPPVPVPSTTTLTTTTTTTTITAAPLPNSVTFTKEANFSTASFESGLASFLHVSQNAFSVTPSPTDPNKVVVTFNTGNRSADYQLTQDVGKLSPSDLSSIGTSGAVTNAAANSPPTATTPAAAPAAKNNTGMIAGIVIAVLAVVALAGFFVWNRNRNASRTATYGHGDTAFQDGYVAHQDFSDFRHNVNSAELSSVSGRGEVEV